MTNDFLIGDTIQLEATIKNYADAQTAPDAAPTVSVYRADGSTKLLDGATSSKVDGTTAEYTYEWQIATSLTASERLIALWEWLASTVPHKKKLHFYVVTLGDYNR